MPGAFPHALHTAPVSGDHLELLGKHAAAQWARGEHKTLTEAVTTIIKGAHLSPEQVRRVVEFTNIAAFHQEFAKEGAHRVVSFSGGPADAPAILKTIDQRGAVVTYDRGLSDYQHPPPERTKTASRVAEAELDQLFSGPRSLEPVAEPYQEAMEMWDKLAAIRDRLAGEINGLEVMYHDLHERLFREVKQAALEGTSLGEISQAWAAHAPSPEHLKVAFVGLAPRLLENGVFSSLDQMNASLEKTGAARLVNPHHPLVTEFGDYCEALSKLAESRATLGVVEVHMAPLHQFLKLAAAGGVLPEAWRHYKGGVEWAGKHIGNAAEFLVNNPAKPGSVAEGAHKVVSFLGTKVAPVVAAHQVYKRVIEPNPVYQTVTDTILPSTPGTQQFYGF